MIEFLNHNFYSLLLILSLPVIIFKALEITSIFQRKEYRKDRLQEVLNFRITISKQEIYYIFFILIVLIAEILTKNYALEYLTLIIPINFLKNYYLSFKNNLFVKRPKITLRSFFVLFMSFGLMSLLIGYPYMLEKLGIIPFYNSLYVVLLILGLKFSPHFAALANFMTLPLVSSGKSYLISKTKAKLKDYKNLKVIAITGSVGKTSTKYFLHHLLSERHKVLSSQGSQNTTLGLCNLILNKLTKNFNYIILEMGAYKSGEIKEMCEICPPNISLITALSNQHIALFGSYDNLKNAKSEIIRFAKPHGKFFSNTEVLKQLDLQIFEGEVINIENTDLKIHDVVQHKSNIGFKLTHQKEEVLCSANILSLSQFKSLEFAIQVAFKEGIKLKDIAKRCKNLPLIPSRMQLKSGINGSTFIDDTSNVSELSIQGICNYIKKYKNSRRILVFQPIQDLGTHAKEIHQSLGEQMAKSFEIIYVTDEDFFSDLEFGVKKSKSNCQIFRVQRRSFIFQFSKSLDKNDVVVFAGKGSGILLNLLRLRKSKK